MASGRIQHYAQTRTVSSYAEDRAAIEDLQARYLFALDFHDPDLYVSTFTEDGVLDYGSGDVKGRQAIKDVIARMPKPAARRRESRTAQLDTIFRTSSSRSMATKPRDVLVLVSLLQRQSATAAGVFDGFGHYEDELVKVNGKWFFTKRKIFNEGRDEWAYKGGKNPAW